MKDKWICLAILGLLFFSTAAASDNTEFEKTIVGEMVSLYSLDTNSTSVEIIKTGIPQIGLDYDSLTVSPMSEAPADGLMPILISVYQKTGEILRGQARIKIRQYLEVLVTSDRIKQHETISPDKVSLERMEITSLAEKPIVSTDELKGKWTKRTISKGQILMTGMVEEIPAITTGQGVSIIYHISNLEITAAGKALESGYRNETIKVRNTQSGRIINCSIIDGETVQVLTP